MKHIQWFPGHMTKAMRMMEENVKLVDGVLVVLDARAPAASFNKNLRKLFGSKPVLYLLNKADLADDRKTDGFLTEFSRAGLLAARCIAASASAAKNISEKVAVLLREKFARDEQRGIVRPPKLMVAGIPNTGKSTVINALACEKRAVTGDKAGVTRGKQWIRCAGFELLDTPGTMPPAFENQELAVHLALLGSINDDIWDTEEVAFVLLGMLGRLYPDCLKERYGVEDTESAEAMFEQICRRRGFMRKGGFFDYERAASAIIDDFRKGRTGKITLESAEEYRGFFG